MKLAVCFAGQGAQSVKMGEEIYNAFETSRASVDQASQMLGYSLTDLIFNDNPLLHITRYTQPAILATSISIFEAVKQSHALKIDAILGFSLGEYTALHALGVFDFAQIIRLIDLRAKLMEESATLHQGGMAAFLNADVEALRRVCEQESTMGNFVGIANYNSLQQVVIAGHEEALARVINRQEETKARRVTKLNVSGAFHSPLMLEASLKMHHIIDSIHYETPNTTWVMNVTGKVYNAHEDLARILEAQMISPVQFVKSVETLQALGITHVIEIGPGSVLQGLIKKINPSISVMSVNTLEDIKAIGEFLCD